MGDGAADNAKGRVKEAGGSLTGDDSLVMGDAEHGGTFPPALAAGVTVPVLVLSGGSSPDWFLATGQRIADALPDGRHEVLAGADHVVPPDVLVPVLLRFL